MIKKLNLAIRMGWLKVTNQHANSAPDYDKASDDYDSFFSNRMGKYSLDLIDKLEISQGNHVLELACGTGFITEEIARRLGEKGCITAVDQSKGMLNIAKKK